MNKIGNFIEFNGKKIRKLENQLAQDPAYVEWQECRMELARKWKRFRSAEEARQDLFD